MAPLDFSVKITFGDCGPGNKGNGASCENKQAEKAFPGWPLYTLNTFPLSAASQNIFWANSFFPWWIICAGRYHFTAGSQYWLGVIACLAQSAIRLSQKVRLVTQLIVLFILFRSKQEKGGETQMIWTSKNVEVKTEWQNFHLTMLAADLLS